MNHEDFRPMTDAEFRERFPAPASQGTPEPEVPRETPLRKANDIARQAASLAYKIESTVRDPAQWKAHIDAAPEELRECLREYMRQRWRALKERERRAAGGKRSAQGDAAIEELSRRYGRG